MALDLNNIKTQIKSILDTANTTTATQDLSANMSRRVQRVFKTNVEKIPVQGSLYPAVTIYYSDKSIESATIARTQTAAKRKAVISVRIAGMVYNPLFANIDEDPADEDLELLMENMEEVLRANPDVNSTTTWSMPRTVEYHSGLVDEETHMRVGLMDFEMTVWY